MSTDIEGIKARAAWDPEKYRDWMGFEMRFTVGEMKAVLAELEKAQQERDAARLHVDHLTSDGPLAEIIAAHVALDISDDSDRKLSLAERIERTFGGPGNDAQQGEQ